MEPHAKEMTVRDYLAVVQRRWWIVAGAVFLTTGVAIGLSAAATPIYEARAQMLVQTGSTDSLFGNSIDLQASSTRNVANAIQVLEGERVRSRVVDNLGLDRLPPAVSGAQIASTDVVSVSVRSQDPETAQILADAYVQAYIDERREQAVGDLIAASIQLQNTITEIEAQAAALPEGDTQRTALLSQAGTFRQTLTQLQVDAALKTGGASVVRSASVPISPVEPRPIRAATLAALVGLMLGLGAAFAIDYFDDSVRIEQDLERLTPLPVLAVVPVDAPRDNRPVAISSPADFAVEVYRGLRTNLQFLGLDRPIKVIQVTSSLPGEGKTTTATNLAVVLAQTGRSVVIVDADLRRPRIHEVFGGLPRPGFVDLLVGMPVELVAQPVDSGSGSRIEVIPSGTVPGNPSELLASQRCRDMITGLGERYDFVIVDSAPVLPVADSIALARAADAVLFVAQSKRISRRDVAEALERLERVHAPVVGLVLNQATRNGRGREYGYGYSGYGNAYGVPNGTERASEGASDGLAPDIAERQHQ